MAQLEAPTAAKQRRKLAGFLLFYLVYEWPGSQQSQAMIHWNMMLILGGAVLWAFFYEVFAFRRHGWRGGKLLLTALVLGFVSELVAFSLRPNGSAAWSVWLYMHLPASLALDPLYLSFSTWKWVTIGLYSVVEAALWLFYLEQVQSKPRVRNPK